MIIFVLSLVGASFGAFIGGSLGGNNMIPVGAFAGFSLPYAIVIENIYRSTKKD